MADGNAPTLAQLCSLHFAAIIGNGRVPPIDCSLPASLGDSIISGMRRLGLLNEETLATFTRTPLDLSRFDASGCGAFASQSLMKLNKYADLDSVNISYTDRQVEFMYLVNRFDLTFFVKECLHERAASNLRHLNISGDTKIVGAKALLLLPRLESLILSSRPICQKWLSSATSFTPALKVIDITGTNVTNINWLKSLKLLEVLIMHNVKVRTGCVHETFRSLSRLRALDISKKLTDFVGDGSQDSHADLALSLIHILSNSASCPWPYLMSLDMSGNSLAGAGIDSAIEMVDIIIERCPRLQQVSVLATPLDGLAYVSKVTRDVSVINCATRQNAMEALTHYWNTDRDVFTSHALHAVYYCLQSLYDDFSDIEVRECARLVCLAMHRHINNIGVQMAGSACLYHLCKMKRIRRLSVSDVQLCMDRCLDAAEAYRQMVQLQKNVWLTICNDYLLQLPGVDFYRTCKVALESMLSSRDSSVARMTIAIVSIVTPKMRPPEARELTGDERYVRHLVLLMNENLRHLKNTPGPRAENSLFTLKFTLSALWNLTDESVLTCQVFHDAGGVTTCFEILSAFHDHSNIQTKVLGILNNVAEVNSLKEKMLENEHWITLLIGCLMGPFRPSDDSGRNRSVERSYFAAGVLSNLLLAPVWIIDPCLVTREFVDSQLVDTIMSWPELRSAMVSYRSFTPFVRIMAETTLSGPLMWCLWGVNHVLTHKEKNSASMGYHAMLQQSDVPVHCMSLARALDAHPVVRRLAAQIESVWLTSSNVTDADELMPHQVLEAAA